MSKHWQPEGDRARLATTAPGPPPSGTSWPIGATAGLLLVAACCLTVGVLLYRVAGPRVVIEENAAGKAEPGPGPR